MASLYKILFFIFKLLCINKVVCFPSSNETHSLYDQRQTGKYNIHISLRDVSIIELDRNEFSDETINNGDEYYYDDEDLTIKPISNFISTTIKTPQITVNNSLKSEIVENPHSQQVEKKSESPHTQLTNFTLLESGFDSRSNSSLFPSSKRTTIKTDEDATLSKELVSQGPSKAHLVFVPLHKRHKENNKDNSRFVDVPKDHRINKPIPNIPIRCRNNQLRDAYGNCRSLKRSSFLKTLFSVLQLARMKNN
ncbi:uncharacterized protein LOC129914278 [Episyrphus balteatus]|uniref:uncharacterized protein LOC129914278 n=1 Tax=Episyrphus balteatus TaxID=286459 RepID=UPI00248639D2|nr:uncharacterized protein LOC129914278 [Episyrphus balteatus]